MQQRTLALASGVLILCAACTAAPPTARYAVYNYSVAGPTVDRHPGERLPVVWKATPSGSRSEPPPPLRVCVAIAGPFGTVEELKAFPVNARNCPLTGSRVVLASVAVEIDPSRSDDVPQDLLLPTTLAPGFYQFISVQMFGLSDTGDSMSGAGILRVVAP